MLRRTTTNNIVKTRKIRRLANPLVRYHSLSRCLNLQTFSPQHFSELRKKLKIFEKLGKTEGNEPALKADLLIRDNIAKSHQSRPVASVLQSCEREKKQKYIPGCSERHITFTPLICSVEEVLGKEFQLSLTK